MWAHNLESAPSNEEEDVRLPHLPGLKVLGYNQSSCGLTNLASSDVRSLASDVPFSALSLLFSILGDLTPTLSIFCEQNFCKILKTKIRKTGGWVAKEAGIAPGHEVGNYHYSSTKICFFAQMSFRIFGHTVTLTSPRWALRRIHIWVRDWPMPPPTESGTWLFRMAW